MLPAFSQMTGQPQLAAIALVRHGCQMALIRQRHIYGKMPDDASQANIITDIAFAIYADGFSLRLLIFVTAFIFSPLIIDS
jgi:hypothetical protein